MYSTYTTSISTQLKLTYRTHSNTPAYHFTSHRNQYLALTLREQEDEENVCTCEIEYYSVTHNKKGNIFTHHLFHFLYF